MSTSLEQIAYQNGLELIETTSERTGYKKGRMEMNERERIGTLLAQKRNEVGLSVRALAEIAGVSYQNITKIENGKYNVSIDILSKIVNALNCKIDIVNI